MEEKVENGREWKKMKKMLIEWKRIFCLIRELSMAARNSNNGPGVATTGTCVRAD